MGDINPRSSEFQEYRTAIRLDPRNPRLYEWRGQDYELKGNKENAHE